MAQANLLAKGVYFFLLTRSGGKCRIIEFNGLFQWFRFFCSPGLCARLFRVTA